MDDKSNILINLKYLIKRYEKEYELESFDDYYEKLAIEDAYDTKLVAFIKRLLQFELKEELRIKIVDGVFGKYTGMSEESFSRELYMSEEQLEHIIIGGHNVGNHGYNHYWWNTLSKEDMQMELDLSTALTEKSGRYEYLDRLLSLWFIR